MHTCGESHSPSRTEHFLWLGWCLVILAHVLQPTYPLCLKRGLGVWPKPLSSQIFGPWQSPGDVSCLGMVCVLQIFSAMLDLFGLMWSLPSVASPESLKSMLTRLTPVLFVLHSIYFFLFSLCCQFFL